MTDYVGGMGFKEVYRKHAASEGIHINGVRSILHKAGVLRDCDLGPWQKGKWIRGRKGRQIREAREAQQFRMPDERLDELVHGDMAQAGLL